MQRVKTCFMFPAFEMRYRSFDLHQLPDYLHSLARCLERLGGTWVTVERYCQAYASPVVFEALDDSQKHDLSFLSGCMFSDYLQHKGVVPDCIIPYSMGLFSALYAADCLDLEDGWRLMRFVCRTAHEVGPRDGAYGMGVVMGLSEKTMTTLLRPFNRQLHVSDVIQENIFVLSGRKAEMEEFFACVRAHGDAHARFLAVERPYHSPFMAEAEKPIRSFAESLPIRPPRRMLLSGVTQRPLQTVADIQDEVCTNVINPLHWRSTVQAAVALGTNVFVECGMSESLCKLVKLELNHVQVYHPKRFKQWGLSRSKEKSCDAVGLMTEETQIQAGAASGG